ncbi:MAG: hypothetical protein GY851_07080 [bacterium]|nr:hypothetical protein [bacterium]
MTRSTFLCALALSLLLTAGSAHAFTADVNLWPIMVVDGDESGYDVRFLVPFGQFKNQDGEHVEALRPLYINRRKEGSSERSLDLVWPIANVATDGGGDLSWRAFPLFYNMDSDDEPDFAVFPLLWTWWQGASSDPSCGVVLAPAWAEWEKGERDWSGGVIPVYAQWRDGNDHGIWLVPLLWSRSRYSRTMAAFPLYLDVRRDDSRATWLAPVYWGRRGGRTRSLVVFPVFWHGRNSTVLFPLYWNFDHASLLMVPPIYGHQRGGDENWFFVLFPSYLQTNDEDYRTHRVLWPLLTWGGDGKDSNEFGLWPLYGRKHQAIADDDMNSDGGKRAWALFPLFWTGNWTNKHGHKADDGESRYSDTQRYVNLFPFLWVGNKENWREKDGERTWERAGKHFNVFPFLWCRSSELRYLNREDPEQRMERELNVFPLFWSGRSETRVLDESGEPTDQTRQDFYHWLLPLYTYNADENSKIFTAAWPLWRSADQEDMDQYSVLWRLMDARFYPDGDHRISVLWRGFRHETDGDSLKVDMFPFLTYRRPEPGTTQFQFLEGLFATGKEDGRRFLRLFWLPKVRL